MSKYEPVITCRQPKGETTTAAYVYGAWAVHHTIGSRDPRDWTITQVATGLAIPHSQTEILTKAHAIEVAKILDAEIGSRRITRAISKRVVEIIHAVVTGRLITTTIARGE